MRPGHIGEIMAKKSRHRRQERQKSTKATRLSAALLYASHGVPVVPVHGLKNSSCTCGDRHCKRPGRHPRTKLDIADATLDREEIRRMWRQWPNAKIGIVMGWPGKLMALMTDGPEGWQTLRGIAVTEGTPRRTVTIRDRDRRLRLFRVDGKVPHSREIASGVRILGDGDLALAPSTLTGSNNERRFASGRAPGEIDIARAPVWLQTIGPATNASARSSAGPDQVAAAPATPHSPRHEHKIMLVRTSEIEPERITWIWPGVIASGRVTGMVGYPASASLKSRSTPRRPCRRAVNGREASQMAMPAT